MLDRGDQLGFAHEALTERLVGRQLGGEQLERHLPAHADVLREHDVAHAAPTELGLDAVGAQPAADGERDRHRLGS